MRFFVTSLPDVSHLRSIILFVHPDHVIPSHRITPLQHLPQHPHQRPVLQCGRHPLLIRQLLIDLLPGTVRPFLDPHIDPKPRRQRLLESDAHAQPDHGREAAVRDGGCDVDGADGEGGAGGQRGEVDVREVDDGEGAEGEGVFGIGYGGDEVCEVGEELARLITNWFVDKLVGMRGDGGLERVGRPNGQFERVIALKLFMGHPRPRVIYGLHAQNAGSVYAQAIDPVI